MRKLILAMQMTLDGFVAGPNGEMDWLIASDDEWEEMFKDLASVDTMLVGARMYPGYSGYWRSVLKNASSEKNELMYARIADRTQHLVFSKTLKTTDWKNSRIVADAEREIIELKNQKGGDMFAWGGASLANSLIKHRLVDEYRITINPCLLGHGLRLFGNQITTEKLSLKDARQLSKGIVVLRYLTGAKR